MATVFVSGGSGFIGQVFVRQAVARGDEVWQLARSTTSQKIARENGATPIEGDLLVPGAWQARAAEAEHVVHLAQPQTFGGRITSARAGRYRDERVVMDRNLLEPLDPKKTKRIVYVAGTSYYGNLGLEKQHETATPVPRGWGPYIAPAIDALSTQVARGLPVVVAFPGYVYGDGSWFREYVITPLQNGKRINAIGGRSRLGSHIHVDDCARAIVHLLDHGEAGERYFIVDDRPNSWAAFYEIGARAMGFDANLRRVPPWLIRLLVGSVVTDSLLSDAVLSNEKLKKTRFALQFPTIDEGLAHVAEAVRQRSHARNASVS